MMSIMYLLMYKQALCLLPATLLLAVFVHWKTFA